MKDHILVLGGDGYLGWPTAMRLSAMGYEVTVVDNYLRRDLCSDLDIDFLYPVPALAERTDLWLKISGKKIHYAELDLSLPDNMRSLFIPGEYEKYTGSKWPGKPCAVIHYAEQPSAPFSLLDYRCTDLTIVNNLRVTNNLLCAIRDFSPESRIVHIGTMGEYGTPNIDIEEGWLEIEHKGRKDRFLYPRQASSIYHTTKIMDTDLMWYFVRAFKLSVTDLMQGPVYGIDTAETLMDTRLRPYFNYDDIFGTVLNRFIVQAACGYPLTVYGKGGQTRGYININDTLQCVLAAITNPAKKGELRIFNQITETFSVLNLADRVKEAGKSRNLDVKIEHVQNPRTEAEEHYYNPTYRALRELGVKPHPLDRETLLTMIDVALEFKSGIRPETIFFPARKTPVWLEYGHIKQDFRS